MEVKKELLQAVLNYLQERPYKDVAGLISALMQSKQIDGENQKEE